MSSTTDWSAIFGLIALIVLLGGALTPLALILRAISKGEGKRLKAATITVVPAPSADVREEPQTALPPLTPSNAPRADSGEKLYSRSVFISYRRADSQHITGRIYDRLTAQLGRESVFKDVDSIPLGLDS